MIKFFISRFLNNFETLFVIQYNIRGVKFTAKGIVFSTVKNYVIIDRYLQGKFDQFFGNLILPRNNGNGF